MKVSHLFTEQISGATRARSPILDDVVWIGPDEVAERSLLWDFLVAIEQLDLVAGVDLRRKTAVHAENLVVDQRRNRHQVEQLAAALPRLRVAVLVEALVVEAVHLQ